MVFNEPKREHVERKLKIMGLVHGLTLSAKHAGVVVPYRLFDPSLFAPYVSYVVLDHCLFVALKATLRLYDFYDFTLRDP